MRGPGKHYGKEVKEEFLKRYQESGRNLKEFCKNESITYKTAHHWCKKANIPTSQSSKHTGPYSPEQRKQAVEAFFKSGLTQEEFSKVWKISPGTLNKWLKKYEADGAKGLETYAPAKEDDKRKGRKISEKVLDEIVKLKQSEPRAGLKYIQQVLGRFRGIKISTGSIKKTLEDADLPLVEKEKKRTRSTDKIRFFERANPMQLWQSDITSYMMTRHSQRVYLTVFMDDCSRYIVSWNLAVRQTTEFVCEALLKGVARFGKPEEVLTDQGRQYFAWRGKSDFQRVLDREGIKHVVSRSHHPQTLGKCERFWETVGQEFWERVKPQDLSDAKERFVHFINHYNHFRPHQGINGSIPADKFFGLDDEIRKTVEETMVENELRLAVGESPRSPVFLVGQIGDHPISLHGEGGKLVLRTPEGGRKELSYGEFGHFKKGGDNGNRDKRTDSKKTWQEEGTCDADEISNSGERTLGISECGGKTESTQDSDSATAILDGTSNEERRSGGIENSTTEDLATIRTSSSGNGSRTFETTTNAQRSDIEQGRRSEISEEENRRTREDDLFIETIDRYLEGDAGVFGCDNSIEESEVDDDGKESSEG